MKTIGKCSYKPYQCNRCGHEEEHQTNHWGSIYNIRCHGCAWKNPMQPFSSFTCTELIPEGYEKPEEWTFYQQLI
jgi:hypothetical protein